MSAFVADRPNTPYLVYGTEFNTSFTLTANGGTTSAIATRTYANNKVKSIHCFTTFNADNTITTPTILRASLYWVRFNESASTSQLTSGMCEILIPRISVSSIRRNMVFSFYSSAEQRGLFNCYDSNLFGSTGVAPLTFDGVATNPSTVNNTAFMSADCVAFIPNRFFIVFQNMSTSIGITMSNIRIFFT
jgi:hypothetical protein